MPKIVNHQEIKHDLLKKSVSLFAKKGFLGISMRGLAGELKVTTGTLYHYFTGKEDLYNKMLLSLANDDTRELIKILSGSKNKMERYDHFLGFLESKVSYFQEAVLLLLDFNRIKDEEIDNLNFKNALEIYECSLHKHLGLRSRENASKLLDYLIGIFTRSLLTLNTGVNFDSVKEFIISIEKEL